VRISVLFVVAACASAAPKSAIAPLHSDGAGSVMADPRGQIRTLDDHIDQQLGQMGLSPPSDGAVAEAMTSNRTWAFPAGGVADSCPAKPSGQQCDDVCTLADGICDDAQKICNLSDQLDGDAWAVQKCESGKLSCQQAKDRCCGCS